MKNDVKKILIVNNNLHIGGVQKALINFLNTMPKDLDITLLLFYPDGELRDEVPKWINVISVKSLYKYLGMTKYDVANKPISKLIRSVMALISRILGRDVAIKIMSLSQKTIYGYDVAISYLHNGSDKIFYGGCNDFVLNNIKCDKKIAFLHCDYEKSGSNTEKNANKYSKFDVIAACSKGCKDSFVKCLPNLESKVKVVLNCQNYSLINEKSNIGEKNRDNHLINILTVARLGKEKGVIRAIKAMSNIEGILGKVKYRIIGDGIEKKELINTINELDLENVVECLGEMVNPYGYIKEADLLLIPSYSEAAPLVIGEAAFLGTPILSTETSSSYEMIINKGVGWVCENSVEGIKDKLLYLVNNPEIIEEKKKQIQEQIYNNDECINQFLSLI